MFFRDVVLQQKSMTYCFKSATNPLEKTASIHVVHCVSTRHVTDSTGVVYMNVKTTNNVMVSYFVVYNF